MRERTAIGWLGLWTLALWAGCGHDRFVPGRACTPGDERPCYDGASKTEGVGPCQGGTQTCLADASAWGPCEGEVVPVTETCKTEIDDDCDGVANEDGEGCTCVPGQQEGCYEGPEGTVGVGVCSAGTRTCEPSGVYGGCDDQVVPSAEDCDSPGDEDCDGIACSAPIWGQLFGDVQGYPAAAQQARAIALGPSGDLFVAFDFQGSIQIGSHSLASAGGQDVAVARLSPAGAVLWAQRIGGEKDESTGGLAIGEDGNPVLAATFYSAQLTLGSDLVNDGIGPDALVVKLGGMTGAPLWARRVGVTGSLTATAIAVAPLAGAAQVGDVVVAGRFLGTLVCNGASCVLNKIESTTYDAYLQAFTGDGANVRWTKTVGGPGSDEATSLAIASDGSVLAGGRVADDAKLDMLTLTPPGSPDPNAFLAKLSKDGEPLWARAYGDTAAQSILSVAVSTKGEVLAGGFSQGAIDFGNGAKLSASPSQAFVTKLASDGTATWARGFAGAGQTSAASVSFDSTGHALVAGSFDGSVDFGGTKPLVAGQLDAFLVKLDVDGAYLWARGFGAADKLDRGTAVAATDDGEVLFAGAFGGAVNFGLGPLQSAGQLDAGLALFQP